MIHLLIFALIVLVVAVVVFRQIVLRGELKSLFVELYEFMPDKEAAYDDIKGTAFSTLEANQEVSIAIERYLTANQHIAPNFEIIKDIVEHSSTELHERIRTLLSMPLYYGLCGTILGIILGLIPLAIDSRELMEHIPILLGGIATAMLGSFFGILITSRAQAQYKDASRHHEKCKRIFYNWFQVKQLPVIGSNPSGPIGQLIRSLSSFNKDFAESAQTISETAAQMSETFQTQRQLLSLMQEFNATHPMHQQVEMTQQITRHVDVIRGFNNSIAGMQDYVSNLQQITQQLQSSTEYLDVVRSLVAILNSEQQSIQTATEGVGQHIQDSHSQLQKLINKSIELLKEQNTTATEALREHLSQNARAVEKHLTQHANLPEILQQLGELTPALSVLSQKIEQLGNKSQSFEGYLQQINSSIQQLRCQEATNTNKLPKKRTTTTAPTLGQGDMSSPVDSTPEPSQRHRESWFSNLWQRVFGRHSGGQSQELATDPVEGKELAQQSGTEVPSVDTEDEAKNE